MITALAELKGSRGEKEKGSNSRSLLFALSPLHPYRRACNHDSRIS